MSLVFKYGSFTGGRCLVKLVSHNVVPRLTNGFPTSYIRTIAIEGRIEADGPTAISAAMQSLENALNAHAEGVMNITDIVSKLWNLCHCGMTASRIRSTSTNSAFCCS